MHDTQGFTRVKKHDTKLLSFNENMINVASRMKPQNDKLLLGQIEKASYSL